MELGVGMPKIRHMKFILVLSLVTTLLPAASAQQTREEATRLFNEAVRGVGGPGGGLNSGTGLQASGGFRDGWPDMRPEVYETRHKRNVEALDRLKKVERAQLSAQDQVLYDLTLDRYQSRVDEFQYGWHLIPITQRGGIQTADQQGGQSFATVQQYESWIGRMKGFSVYMDQTIALMREGMRRRVVHPKVIVRRIIPQIEAQVVRNPEDSPFFRPFKRMPESISSENRERLLREGREAVSAHIIASYDKFKKFLQDEYLPAAFDEVGAWQIPGGNKYYTLLAHIHTTTDLSPDQIHELGLSEVKRIRAEMEKAKEQAGFKGPLDKFFKFLRTDKRFFCKTPDELLMTYRAISKRIDPNLMKVFRTLPRAPYGVEPIPAAIAPDTTTAYYSGGGGTRPGTYWVNLYKPEARPKWEMMALSLHEAVPGHHLQTALAAEVATDSPYRRLGGATAYTEGWGLYAESLGTDMGLYDDPYSRMGQLTYEMWRAVRLVVDTGMHSKHWTRQQAIDFFKENAPKTELDIVNEIDRYITMPGQALAYKIGEMKFKELRKRSEQALGSRFDLREFHDVVLKTGSVPLVILEKTVDDWLKTKSSTATN
jgi:uncharacterized protein (DUF885 family)